MKPIGNVRRWDGVVHVVVDITENGKTFLDHFNATRVVEYTNLTLTVRGVCGRRMKMHSGNRTRLTKDAPTCIPCVGEPHVWKTS